MVKEVRLGEEQESLGRKGCQNSILLLKCDCILVTNTWKYLYFNLAVGYTEVRKSCMYTSAKGTRHCKPNFTLCLAVKGLSPSQYPNVLVG